MVVPTRELRPVEPERVDLAVRAQHDLWNTSNLHTDAVRPGPILDLAVHGKGRRVKLSWTAPGDDGACGRAARYEVRASSTPITTHALWQRATPIAGAPGPSPAGFRQTFAFKAPAKRLFYAVRTLDKAGNLSALSNSASPRR